MHTHMYMVKCNWLTKTKASTSYAVKLHTYVYTCIYIRTSPLCTSMVRTWTNWHTSIQCSCVYVCTCRFMICSVNSYSLGLILDLHSPTYQHFISSVVKLENVRLLRLVSYVCMYIHTHFTQISYMHVGMCTCIHTLYTVCTFSVIVTCTFFSFTE